MIPLLIWDVLLIVLIAVPLVTGGFWIHRPGLKIELADLAVPTAVVAIYGAWVHFKLRKNLKKSWTSTELLLAWKKWGEFLSLRSPLLWVIALAVGVFWSTVSIWRHAHFGSSSFDLGIFTNAMWNLTHGFGYISAPKDGINLFADHQSPIFFLFAPFFALIPRPETLLVLQAFALATGGVALHRLALQYLAPRHWATLAAPLLYWSYLPIRNANAFDFHPEVLMLPLFLWAIVWLQKPARKNKNLLVGTLFVLALLCKESAGPVAVGMGLAWCFGAGPNGKKGNRSDRALGAAAILLGFLTFLIDTQLVPRSLGGSYAYSSMYAQWGDGGFFAHLIGNIRENFLGRARLRFLFFTLAPLGFLPLLGWRAGIAALPGYLMLFLSNGDHRVNVNYHYAIEVAVGLLWAWIIAIHSRPQQKWIPIWCLFWAFAGMGRSEIYRMRQFPADDHITWVRQQLLPCIHPERSMAASDAYVPHLSTRHWIHHLKNLATQCSNPVACIVEDRSVNNWPLTSEDFLTLSEDIDKLNYQETFQCGAVHVYERIGTHGCMICPVICP